MHTLIRVEECSAIRENSFKKKNLTWYSLLNPAFSLREMFVICAFIFLTGMFLFVGGPRFVFSGRAYVDSATLLANDVCNLQSTIKIFFGNVI